MLLLQICAAKYWALNRKLPEDLYLQEICFGSVHPFTQLEQMHYIEFIVLVIGKLEHY